MIELRDIRHFHLFCGLGGGAAGFNRGQARVGRMAARFRCLGGVDSNPAAIQDFERLTGVPGTVLDLFSREQYQAFHGHLDEDSERGVISMQCWAYKDDGSICGRPASEIDAARGIAVCHEHRSIEQDISVCIGCGCDDDHACWDDASEQPCHWLRLDRAAGLGVCSACPDDVERWGRGDRAMAVPR